jgi:ribosome-binding ATPase YchF (GTP1/OBG family)
VKLGDCFRLGSVGLVVSEMKTKNGEEQRLDNKMLQYLKDEALAIDKEDDTAALAAEEIQIAEKKKKDSAVAVQAAREQAIANGDDPDAAESLAKAKEASQVCIWVCTWVYKCICMYVQIMYTAPPP